jgi:hypothetical protein
MKHSQHETFISAIHSRKKLQVVFYSKKDGTYVTRKCAPLDFGPKAKEKIPVDRYHLWDFLSPSGPHTASLEADQIRSISPVEEIFDPGEIVLKIREKNPTWIPQWHIRRDWGQYS